MVWDYLANEVEDTYGGFVDREEGFFNCPECGEPIYDCDWNDSDFALSCRYIGRLRLYCPVCEAKLIDEGEEFN